MTLLERRGRMLDMLPWARGLACAAALMMGTAATAQSPVPADRANLEESNLLADPGFMQTEHTTPDGWTLERTTPAAEDAEHVIRLSGDVQGAVSAVHQQIQGMIGGRTYDVQLQWRLGEEAEQDAGAATGALSVLVDDSEIGLLSPEQGAEDWMIADLSFVAQTATAELTLRAVTSGPDSSVLINWVGVYAVEQGAAAPSDAPALRLGSGVVPPETMAKGGTVAPTSTGADACLARIMNGEVDWGGGTEWAPANAEVLCGGATDPDARIACFRSRVDAEGWQNAIASCIADDTAPAAAAPEDAATYQGDLPTATRILAYSINDQVRDGSGGEDYFFDVRDDQAYIVLGGGLPFNIVPIQEAVSSEALAQVGLTPEALAEVDIVAFQVSDGPLAGQFLRAFDDMARFAEALDADAFFFVRPPLEPDDGNFASFESVASPGQYLRHQGLQLKLDPANAESPSLLRRDATFRFLPLD